MPRENGDIAAGDYVFQYIQDFKTKYKLGGHSAGHFLVMSTQHRTLVTQLGPLVELLNSDSVFKAPTPIRATSQGDLDETPRDNRDMEIINTEGHQWPLSKFLDHRANDG